MPSKLKFSVGYQLPDPQSISGIVAAFAADIEEVYFPWAGVVNGRGISIVGTHEQRLMEGELEEIHALGVRLNMLWNGNCYGGKSISSDLERKVVDTISPMLDHIGLASVTTASLFVAACVKRNFPQIDVRASVNMGICSVTALKCVQDAFDSFYVARELNRFPARIKPLRDWCVANKKRLFLLANSGCLKDCPAHTFHDNLVSHEDEVVRESSPWRGFRGVCWDYYADPSNRASFLLDSTWIRPEEIDGYGGLVDGIKLATRMHRDPERVIASYAQRKFSGNILSLGEPDFSGLCHLENAKFSAAWLERFGALDDAGRENYCKEEFERVRC